MSYFLESVATIIISSVLQARVDWNVASALVGICSNDDGSAVVFECTQCLTWPVLVFPGKGT
jgi:hypothetical protein